MACALAHRLPTVAKVFVRGTIDLRLVSMIIARTDNVEDVLMREVDEAIARHCEKWMKLSKPKLRDRVDQWVAEFDPAGVRIAPTVEEQPLCRGRVGESGDGVALGSCCMPPTAPRSPRRLDALAATVCEHDPRSHAAASRRCRAGALGRGEATLGVSM